MAASSKSGAPAVPTRGDFRRTRIQRSWNRRSIPLRLAAREADPPSFLITLESRRSGRGTPSGARIVVAALNSPPFSSEAERSLEHLAEICQTNGVRVVVLDVGEGARSAPNADLNALVTKTNGTWVRQAKALEPSVAMVAPADETQTLPPAPAVSAAPAATTAAESVPQAPGAIPKFEIPVHIRFIRISGTGSVGSSMLDHEADFGETFTAQLDRRPGRATPALP